MNRGEDKYSGQLHIVCGEICAIATDLFWVQVEAEIIYPRSCSHCYYCGIRCEGGPGTGCALDQRPGRPLGIDCPEYDFTATRLYEEAAIMVGEVCQIPDIAWKALHGLARKYPEADAEHLAQWVLDSPKLFKQE